MPRRRTSGRRTAIVVAVVAALFGARTPVSATGLVDPLLHFRQIRTPHFIIYFHQGEEPLAARLSTMVEGVRDVVGASLDSPAPRLTHVVLADQSELANGWATPLPRDIVFLNAAAPSGADFIGRTDDWLRLVFTHEYAHVVHLDRSGAWAWLFRGILGRSPVVFPNLWLPQWQIEGLATWEESALVGEGRRAAGDFRAIERVAAQAGRPLTLDRASGGLVGWPDGHAAYAAGLGFQEYLVERFGQSSLGRIARSTSRRLPFLGTPAYKAVLGESLGSLWRDYEETVRLKGPVSAGPNPAPRRLTHLGNIVVGPRFAPRACATCAEEIVYSAQTPHAFPALRSVSPDGTSDRELAKRYMGATTGLSPSVIVFDRQELRRDVGLYSDLYLFDRRTGDTRPLSRESRLQDPDLSPDGGTIVAVRDHGGQRDLVLVPLVPGSSTGGGSGLGTIRVLAATAETQFSAPRWSPDGRLIAVERRRRGSLPDVVVVDPSNGNLQTVVSDTRARIVTPAWRPDGHAIVAAADFDGEPFDIYEFPLSSPSSALRLTRTAGALWPDVSRDSGTLVFAGYDAEGYDVYTLPYDSAGSAARLLSVSEDHAPPTLDASPPPSDDYSPLPTLPPTSWSPLLVADSDQTRFGAAVSNADLLGRHAYAANATWLIDGPEVVREVPGHIPDWNAAYAYTRWRPSLITSVSRETLFRTVREAGPAQSAATPVAVVQHEIQAGVFVPVVHVRWNTQALASLVRTDTRYQLSEHDRAVSLIASRLAFAYDTTQRYGYSISREHGINTGTTVELARRALGSDADATTGTVDARAYLPGLVRHHVVALRAAGGVSRGSDLARQTFALGSVAASPAVIDFGADALGLFRGPGPSVAGDRLLAATAEYRFPLAVVERGHGTWPLFIRTVHAAVFADAGQVRGTDRASAPWARAVGVELSADAVAGFSLPFAVTAGAAWGDDGRSARGSTFYARLGRAF